MIYRSLLPPLIVLLVMITITLHLINYVGHETSNVLRLENEYSLTINVFKQLNETIKPIMQGYACKVITNPLNYDCEDLASSITEVVITALDNISNGTGGLVKYYVIDYGAYGMGNETTYYLLVRSTVLNDSIRGVIGSSYPFNLCLYSDYVRGIVTAMKSINNTHYFVNNITLVQQILKDRVVTMIKSLGMGNAKVTIEYEGVFSMVGRTENYTVYSGIIHYIINALPTTSHDCDEGATYSGLLYVVVYVKEFINDTYYFAISDAVSIDNNG